MAKLSEIVAKMLGVEGRREAVADALIREATEGSRTGSVARAFEVLRYTVDGKPCGGAPMAGSPDSRTPKVRLGMWRSAIISSE